MFKVDLSSIKKRLSSISVLKTMTNLSKSTDISEEDKNELVGLFEDSKHLLEIIDYQRHALEMTIDSLKQIKSIGHQKMILSINRYLNDETLEKTDDNQQTFIADNCLEKIKDIDFQLQYLLKTINKSSQERD